MKIPSTFSPVLGVCCALGLTSLAHGQYVAPVLQFDQLVRNYNLITFDDANLTFIGNDTEGPLAIGGNLTVGGVPLVNFNQFETSADPTLYVAGTFNVTSNFAHLNSGFASLPGNAGLGVWTPINRRLTTPMGGTLDSTNASHPNAANDPRGNPAPSGWSFPTIRADAIQVSDTLAALAPTGAISVVGQSLTFTPSVASGVALFNLDANLLSGNAYNGQMISNISFNIPTDSVFVVNLLNAAGRTIFGGSGINFNLSDAQAGRLLWNIVAGPGDETAVSLGNGGEFHGSVLAPEIDLANAFNSPINGQIIAESIVYSNSQLHFSGFTPLLPVPEPSTIAALAGCVIAALVLSRRRARAAS